MMMLILLLSARMLMILLMLGLLLFLGDAPPVYQMPVPMLDSGMDWLRLFNICIIIYLEHHHGFCQVASEPARGLHHPSPHL